jgi:hypothetical protein
MAKAAKARTLDFTKVKERGEFNPKHQAPGDYRGQVTGVSEGVTQSAGDPQWVFTIKVGSGTYPYRCQFKENVLWKIRNIFVAAGFKVGRAKIAVDPRKLIGKQIAVSLDDHEYEGRISSEIIGVFPISELGDDEVTPIDDEVEEGDETDEGEEEEDVVIPVDEEEEDEDDEEVPQPKAKKKKKKAKVPAADDDDELEELEIEDI